MHLEFWWVWRYAMALMWGYAMARHQLALVFSDFFPRKQGLTRPANCFLRKQFADCFLRKQFAWSGKPFFLGNSISNLPYADCHLKQVQNVLSLNYLKTLCRSDKQCFRRDIPNRPVNYGSLRWMNTFGRFSTIFIREKTIVTSYLLYTNPLLTF